MLGDIETVTTKIAESRSAAAVFPPSVIHRQIRAAAARAVRRVRLGQLKPLVIERPYHVDFCMRATFQPWVALATANLQGVQRAAADTTDRCFTFQTDSAEAVGNLLNEIEWVVLKP
jgi:D-aminopeptidase